MSERSVPQRWMRPLALLVVVLSWSVVPAVSAQPSTARADKVEAALAGVLAHGRADFFVRFAERADLTAASEVTDWAARGAAVMATLRATAERGQKAARERLTAAGVEFTPFWVSNTILVRDADAAVADGLAKLADVTRIEAPTTYRLPAPAKGQQERTVQAVEWGVAAINADDVWSTYGVRGEGIVVASIDTGADHDHPALVGKYRGNLGGGAFNHHYNWHDPSRVCGSPSLVPCDNNDHGTHTMGTMVGASGADQIGVAPNAKWITAKGCEFDSCSEEALLSSGQWMVAPTDLSGANPRADLRPHIVNNSWGGGGGDPWYQDTVNAWRAAGIFPAFSNGNSGPTCESSGSPGDYANSYSSGAYDINGAIASFSSRGAASSGIKPNLAAPGVNVRSSVDGGGYAAFSGTSMASPHTAGTVALMWSAAPALVGDLAQTSALLDQTAVNTSDLSCGGTAADNNVWGEGRLDAFAAVTLAPRGATGRLTGTVTAAATGAPLAGARVTITGPSARETTTDATGRYSITLTVGNHTATASAFGYVAAGGAVTITQGATTTRDFALATASIGSIGGVVRDTAGTVLAAATVTVLDTPLVPAASAANGSYSFPAVPYGTYQVSAVGGQCTSTQTLTVTVDGAETLNFSLTPRADGYGYTCSLELGGYTEATTPFGLSGDEGREDIRLPFAFPFYGTTYTAGELNANGYLNFLPTQSQYFNTRLPNTLDPNATIYPFWTDLVLDASSGVFTRTAGTAPNRSFLVEWRNSGFYAQPGRVDYQLELYENGQIVFRYRNLDPAVELELGRMATVGIENAAGTMALEYSYQRAILAESRSIRFRPPAGPPPPPPGCGPFTNDTDVAIPHQTTVHSPITVSGCTGNAGTASTVAVNIVHPAIGELVVSLVAPDGSTYVLHNRTGGSQDNIDRTYTVNLSTEARNGLWRLRAIDQSGRSSLGRINSWTLTL